MIPLCEDCPVPYCPHLNPEYAKTPPEVLELTRPLVVASQLRFGWSAPMGFMCLRANLWLFGLDYEDVAE